MSDDDMITFLDSLRKKKLTKIDIKPYDSSNHSNIIPIFTAFKLKRNGNKYIALEEISPANKIGESKVKVYNIEKKRINYDNSSDDNNIETINIDSNDMKNNISKIDDDKYNRNRINVAMKRIIDLGKYNPVEKIDINDDNYFKTDSEKINEFSKKTFDEQTDMIDEGLNDIQLNLARNRQFLNKLIKKKNVLPSGIKDEINNVHELAKSLQTIDKTKDVLQNDEHNNTDKSEQIGGKAKSTKKYKIKRKRKYGGNRDRKRRTLKKNIKKKQKVKKNKTLKKNKTSIKNKTKKYYI